MSQPHLISKSFKDRIASSEVLNNALPGKLHYGEHANTSTPKPFGLLVVSEVSRSYHSGGAALVEYEAILTIYGSQKVGDVGGIQKKFAEAFDASRSLPSVDGQVILMVPTGSTLVEDEESTQGKDIMRGTQTWRISIQENNSVLGK